MSIRCLLKECLVHAGGIAKDGGFTFHVAGYRKIGRRASGNGRDYFNLEIGELKALASMPDTNAVRLALWLLAGLDDRGTMGEAQILFTLRFFDVLQEHPEAATEYLCEACMLRLYGEEGKQRVLRAYGKDRCVVGGGG